MTFRSFTLPFSPILIWGLLACGSETSPTDADAGEPQDAGSEDVDGGSTDQDAAPPDAGFSPECEKLPNLTYIDALSAAQPAIETRARALIRARVEFNSLADDPSEVCSVDLDFEDSNGDGSLQPYENWTLAPEARATDLVSRLSSSAKIGLLAHPTIEDTPGGSGDLSEGLREMVQADFVRFGLTTAHRSPLVPRAIWANNLQELAEGEDFGVPFVLSMRPAHTSGNGRARATGFSQWPQELGLAATDDPEIVEGFGRVVSQEYRAIGVRMALDVSADLATEPRWVGSPFTFGEDAAKVAPLVAAYVRGLQGEALGPEGVAAVLGHFPGAGAAKGGFDECLAKGRFTTYPGGAFDTHAGVFAPAIELGAAAVMPTYGVPEQGDWSGLGGLLDGRTIEQVGATYHSALLTDALRGHFGFEGVVLAPWGALREPGTDPLGAPWGVEALTLGERIAKAVGAGVDQFGGLADPAPIAAALDDGQITDAQVDAAATRLLALMFRLGLFEDPYVDPEQAPALANNDVHYRAGLKAMNRSLVLVYNADKPTDFLNGAGDGTQTGDKGNAGNGTMKVLPAPPGEPYVSAGCAYYVAGDVDLDYVRSVSNGYGLLTNDVQNLKDIDVSTPAERMALSDYIFIRAEAPFTPDPESGSLNYPLSSLEYEDAANEATLAPVDEALAAIAAWAGPIPSQAQIVVLVDAGRPSVVQELLSRDISALYLGWIGTVPANTYGDKIFLDVAFGIVDGEGVLPVGLPASDAAASAQLEDVAGDGQHPTFVRGFGLETPGFE